MLNLFFQFNMCVFKILIAFNLIAGGSKITHSSMGDKLPHGGSAQEIEERDNWAIVGGEKANKADFPYVAFVLHNINKEEADACGGTLIRPGHVLTAAHCVVVQDPTGKLIPTTCDKVQVRLKSDDWLFGGTVYSVESVIVNPVFKGKDSPFPMEGDVAVLRLAKGFKFDELASPMKVPVLADDPILRRLEQAGEKCTIAGWGLDSLTGSFSDKLMTVKLNLIQTADCGKMTRKLGHEINNDSYVCTYTEGKGSCVGDSGGGLICGAGDARFVWGVISFSFDGCAGKDSPVMYARVATYHTFIQSALQETRVATGASGRVASYPLLPVGVIPVVWSFVSSVASTSVVL